MTSVIAVRRVQYAVLVVAVIVVLIIQVLAHLTLPMVLAELPGYEGWVITVQAVSLVFELSALWWLWTPAAGRFFTAAEPTPPIRDPNVGWATEPGE